MLKLSSDTISESSNLAIDASPASVLTDATVVASEEDARVTAFLDTLIARLAPLPPETQREIRQELRAHLECLIAAHEELGATREEAILAAMRQFGDARQIARRYQRAWRSTTTHERPWAAMRLCIAVFGGAMVTMIAGLFSMAPSFQYQPGTLYFYAPIQAMFLGLLLGLPVLAGMIVGWRSPRRAAFGAFCALSLLTLVTLPLLFVCGFDDVRRAVTLGGFFHFLCAIVGCTFLIWLPIGWISATVASAIRNRSVRRHARIIN